MQPEANPEAVVRGGHPPKPCLLRQCPPLKSLQPHGRDLHPTHDVKQRVDRGPGRRHRGLHMFTLVPVKHLETFVSFDRKAVSLLAACGIGARLLADGALDETTHHRFTPHSAGFPPRAAGGAISASAGIPHSRLSLHAIRMVRGRFRFRTSETRWRDPRRRPRSACVKPPVSIR